MKIYKILFVSLLALFFAACNPVKEIETPTEVLKKFVEASQRKDAETMKQALSSGTLKMLQESADKQNTTIDELLKKDDGNALKEAPETRDEVIQGDTATVEVRNKVTNDWDKIPFVKEEGKWKIALDKFMQDLLNKINTNTKTMQMDTVVTNSNASPNVNK